MDIAGIRKRAFATILLAICVALSFLVFMQSNSKRIASQNAEYLSELTAQCATSIDDLVAEGKSFIESTAYLYGEGLDSPRADVSTIREFERSAVFDSLRFIDAAGDDYTSDGVKANIADRDYFQAGMRGEAGIAYVETSRVTGGTLIGFYAPVRYQNEIVGVMVGFYDEDTIRNLLEFELFGHEGMGWLCASDGTVMGMSDPDDSTDDFFSFLDKEGGCEADVVAQVREAFNAGEDVSFTYQEGGEPTVGYAVALDEGGWMLVQGFPASASARILRNANRAGQVLIATLVTLFLVFVLYLTVGFVRERSRMREQARDASDVSDGVARLFDVFYAIDFAEGTYHLVGGGRKDVELEPDGSYGALDKAVLDRIVSDVERAETRDFLSLDSLRAALATRDVTSQLVHAPRNDIEWFTVNCIALERDATGEPLRALLTFQDFTDLHNREVAEQEQLHEALKGAERASLAKTEFLFNMSHDIRTPLNAIIGYTTLAEQEGVTDDQVREYVEKIDASSEYLVDLINDILEMSRIESGKFGLEPANTDLIQVMDRMSELFSTQMTSKDIDFAVVCADVRDPWVFCDEGALSRILLNLASNAYKFTNQGGHVSVALTQLAADGTKGSYEFRVNDDGIGMSEEFARRLFTPFERERTSTVSGIQGTGLGLSIVKRIVDLMGGTISATTKKGEGTEFVVRLDFPLAGGPGEEATEEPVPAQGLAGKRVLLVEDNEINREIAKAILEHQDLVVETVENGQEAVEAVERARPGTYDAILMDIQMPVMDGYTATRVIRAMPDCRRAEIPIVAMTANAFREDVQAAFDAGMDGHIAKPFEVDTMLQTLSDALVRRSARGPEPGTGPLAEQAQDGLDAGACDPS